MVLAMINTAFAQDTQESAAAQWRTVADQQREKFPKLATLMDDADSKVLAFMSFPKANRVGVIGLHPLQGTHVWLGSQAFQQLRFRQGQQLLRY